MNQAVLNYLPHYFLNLGLELPIALLILWHFADRKRSVAACLLGNTITHPPLFLLFPRWFSAIGTAVLFGEMFALTVECAAYHFIVRPRKPVVSLAASAGANFFSLLAGVIIFS